MKLRIGKWLGVGLALAAVVVLAFLPFYMGTKTYPLAIVNGNSMYPTLQNGDIVLFRAPNQQMIANGTIIVFVQSDTGIAMLDSLTKPVVIHRIIGSFVQADGTVYYNTKGDNNNVNDPSAVAADHVIGIPFITIPKVGFLFLFISSSQGLVAIIGFITIFYLGSYEEKLKKLKEKENSFLELEQKHSLEYQQLLSSLENYVENGKPLTDKQTRIIKLEAGKSNIGSAEECKIMVKGKPQTRYRSYEPRTTKTGRTIRGYFISKSAYDSARFTI